MDRYLFTLLHFKIAPYSWGYVGRYMGFLDECACYPHMQGKNVKQLLWSIVVPPPPKKKEKRFAPVCVLWWLIFHFLKILWHSFRTTMWNIELTYLYNSLFFSIIIWFNFEVFFCSLSVKNAAKLSSVVMLGIVL